MPGAYSKQEAQENHCQWEEDECVITQCCYKGSPTDTGLLMISAPVLNHTT